MLILGLDPGSTRTGFGLVESRAGSLRSVTFGIIRPPGHLAFLDRLPHLLTALEALVVRWRPDVVAAEDLFVARNNRVALQLGHVRGVALLPFLRAGIPVREYPARLVKKTVTGYGAAEKKQVRRMVRLLIGVHDAAIPLDASDALAVAVCHAHCRPAAAPRIVPHATT